jgi:hypothetical protein
MADYQGFVHGLGHDVFLDCLYRFDMTHRMVWVAFDDYMSPDMLNDPKLNKEIFDLFSKSMWLGRYPIVWDDFLIDNYGISAYVDVEHGYVNSVIIADQTGILFHREKKMISFKTYLALSEMARNLGTPMSIFAHKPTYATDLYPQTIELPTICSFEGHDIHLLVKGTKNILNSVNHDKKQLVHYSVINKVDKSPYNKDGHIVQDTVDRVADTSILPKGYATRFIYAHFKRQPLPLVSSSGQYQRGHNMWGRLIDMAHADGTHVYRHDGRELHVVTPENKEHHFNATYGKSEDKKMDVLILSHHKLNPQETTK